VSGETVEGLGPGILAAVGLSRPCKCHNSHAYISPWHDGHCCFRSATATCHTEEVAAWEAADKAYFPNGRW
jgi:hypothetical protein